jgi:hypothetical protein
MISTFYALLSHSEVPTILKISGSHSFRWQQSCNSWVVLSDSVSGGLMGLGDCDLAADQSGHTDRTGRYRSISHDLQLRCILQYLGVSSSQMTRNCVFLFQDCMSDAKFLIDC